MWHKLSSHSNGVAVSAAPLLIHGVVLQNYWMGIKVEEILTAKLDTAASMTAIPDRVALKMRLHSDGSIDDLQSFDHSIEPRSYPKFSVRIFIPQWGWKTMSVVGCPRSDVLLGRDIFMGNLLLVNWRSGFGMRRARVWHRPLELLFRKIRANKL